MAVWVAVLVAVLVAVCVAVLVAVWVAVFVGVGVAVMARIVWVFPATVPPDTTAPCPVVWPIATIDELLIALLKNLSASPPAFKLNTNKNVWGVLGARVTKPDKFTKVTDPLALKLWLPINSVSDGS